MNLPVPGCSISLQAALLLLFPAETAARAAEVVTPRLAESVDELPLFVLDAMLPGQSMHLHVFEPRYLALVRRALAQPSRHFGMVAPSANRSSTAHGLESRHSSPCASHGSLVVIDMVSELDPNPNPTPDPNPNPTPAQVSELDGERLLLEVRATRRFKVLRPYRHEAGYVCARAEWVADTPPTEEEARATHLTNLVLGRELRLAIDTWVEEVQRRGKERQAGQLRRILNKLGAAPSASEPEALGLWAAAVLNPLPALGLAPEVRPSCLSCLESSQRLKIVLAALEVCLHRTNPNLSPDPIP